MKSLKTLFILAAIVLTGCSKDAIREMQNELKKQSSLFHMNKEQDQVAALKVTDLDGNPISGAQILIGQALDQPFSSNFVTSDENGVFQAPAQWTMPLTVTLSAPGYLRASYMGQLPNGQAFRLRAADKPKIYELKGLGTGFNVVDKDDKADFALIMPVMKKADLFAFDPSKVVSPEVDMIEVYGQKIYIPSNVSVPKQKEKYSLFTITLEKPAYRMYFENMGTQWVYAARGQFPFEKVVKEMQDKKQFFDLINHFSIQGGALRNVAITGPSQSANLPVNEMIFNQPRNFVAPVYDSAQNLLVVSLSPFNKEFIPTDLKNVPSKGAMKIMTASGSEPQVLALLQNKPDPKGKLDGKMSVSMTPFVNNITPDLLPLISNPQVVSQNLLKVQPVAKPGFLNTAGTYSLLSTFEKRSQNGIVFDAVVRVWEVYGDDWVSEVAVPEWPNDTPINTKKRWEVSFVGSNNGAMNLGPEMLENASHATHAQTDF